MFLMLQSDQILEGLKLLEPSFRSLLVWLAIDLWLDDWPEKLDYKNKW